MTQEIMNIKKLRYAQTIKVRKQISEVHNKSLMKSFVLLIYILPFVESINYR